MMNEAALEKCRATKSTSFAADLLKWNTIMEAYLNGGHAIMRPCRPTRCACSTTR